MMSWPWWAWPLRPAPKREAAPPKLCAPRTGNTPADAPGATGTGAGACTVSLRPGERRRGSRAAKLPVIALSGTRMRKLAKRWLLTRARRSSARPRPPCSTASRTAPRRRPRTRTRLPPLTLRPGAHRRMQAHFETTGTGAIRSGRARETMPSRVPSTKPPDAASHGTRTRTAVDGGLARAAAQVADAVAAAAEDGRVDVAQPGARHQQQAAAAGLAVHAGRDALDRSDAGLGGVRRLTGGQHGQEHDQGCGERARHMAETRPPGASPGLRLTLPRHASGTKVAECAQASIREPQLGHGARPSAL